MDIEKKKISDSILLKNKQTNNAFHFKDWSGKMQQMSMIHPEKQSSCLS